MPNQRVICSIFFDDLKTTENYGPSPDGPFCTTYFMPGIERGAQGHRYQYERKDGQWQWTAYPLSRKGFNLLVVSDMFEREYRGQSKYGVNPVYADTSGIKGVPPNGGIAWSLVNQWVTNRTASSIAPIGVFICAGDEPTEAELRKAEADQTRMCQFVIADADDKWIRGQRALVTDFPPKAAKWLGDTAHPWVEAQRPVHAIQCPMCRKSIDSECVVCPHCNHVVDFSRFAQYQESKDRAEAQLAKIRARLGAEAGLAATPLTNEQVAESLGVKVSPPPNLNIPKPAAMVAGKR